MSSFPEWEKRNRNKLLPGTVNFRDSGNLKYYKIKNLKPYNVPDLGKVHHQGRGLSSDQNFVTWPQQTFSR